MRIAEQNIIALTRISVSNDFKLPNRRFASIGQPRKKVYAVNVFEILPSMQGSPRRQPLAFGHQQGIFVAREGDYEHVISASAASSGIVPSLTRGLMLSLHGTRLDLTRKPA